jgi:hypothetical protein
MAQRLVTDKVNTVIPDAYPDVQVRSQPVGIAAGGAIVIIGEADSGDRYDEQDLKKEFYSPDQYDRVEAKYGAGSNIADAMDALTAPANDTEIQGSISGVYILKTNKSTKATAALATAYGSLDALNSGKKGNEISYKVTESQSEIAPTLTSDTIPAFGAALDGAEFTVRLNGGALTTITLGVGGHTDAATLAAEIDAALPAGMSCTDATATTITISVDADVAAHTKGWGKSFEIAGDNVDLVSLGLDAGLVKSAAEAEVEVSVVRQSDNINETLEVLSPIALEIGYEGTTATITTTATGISTTVTGGSGVDLTANYADFKTLGELVDYINSQVGYTASTSASLSQKSSASLDQTTTGIASTNTAIKPGRIKKNIADFKAQLATSVAVSTTVTATQGLPDATASRIYLAGGAKGATLAADVNKAIAKAESVKANFIVPLFSRDAVDDISDSLTEAASTYTIDAIHADVKSHVLKMSTIKLKRYRVGCLSYKGLFDDAVEKAGTLATYRSIITCQDVDRSSQGATKTFQPWMGAVIAAGMQSAGFYKAVFGKFANIIAFRDPSGFDSGNQGDLERALEAGLFVMQDVGDGPEWVSDQTTYGLDTNFVYNSLQAVYISDRLADDFSSSLARRFKGKSLADIDGGTVISFVQQKMEEYKRIKLIAASQDAPLGYKNLKIRVRGPILEISIEVKLATAIYFIPITLNISQVELEAAA